MIPSKTHHLLFSGRLSLMPFTLVRLFVMALWAVWPTGWCGAQVLHSSQNPMRDMNWSEGEGLHSSVRPEGWIGDKLLPVVQTSKNETEGLKEPVIPKENLEKGETEDDVKTGTFYESGMATYYSSRSHGAMMASGQRYHKEEFFCAHKTLPFGTKLRVVNKKNGLEVIVDVRDRGPFAKGRIVDLSNKAAAELKMLRDGVVPVDIYVIEE